MADGPLTRTEAKAQTRARLVDAAERVFARRGYQGASVDEVAREAGFTTGAVYSNFGGKEELLLAVYEEVIEARRREMLEAAAAGGDGAERRAAAVADQWMRRVAERSDSMVMLIELWSHAMRDETFRREFGPRFGALRIVIGRLAEEIAAERGTELALPPEEMGTVLKALGNGFALEKLADPDGVPDELFGRAVELLLGARMEAVG